MKTLRQQTYLDGMTLPDRTNAVAAPATRRDARIDVVRGLALVMIFVDHMPQDTLNWLTLHNFGFCDAAEVFVLLAGFSSMMAYGKVLRTKGVAAGLRKIALRCLRIYAAHIFLVLLTLAVVLGWTTHFHLSPTIMAPILAAGSSGLEKALTLRALPGYLDILPLYVVLLSFFPVIYFTMRRGVWLALAGSAAIWLAANLDYDLNLPNWIDGKGWYFNPFTWQFLFTIGSALALAVERAGGSLPRHRWLVALCWAYLGFAFLEGAPWPDWHLPSLRLFQMASPDKSHLSPLRIADILALAYLVMSATRLGGVLRNPVAVLLGICGKHSLEVFVASCVAALFGRLMFRTYGSELLMQIGVNCAGLAIMLLVACSLERNRPIAEPKRPEPAYENAHLVIR